jgi:LacI family transcriptional regulator
LIPLNVAIVTFQQIALAAGVSKATVSLALRDDPRITEPIRVRVRAIAEKLGYRPNPLISIHMAHLRGMRPPQWRASLSYLAQFTASAWKADPIRPANLCFNGAKARAQALGFSLELSLLGELRLTADRVSRMLVSRGVPGVIIAPWPRSGHGETINLQWSHFAAATINYSLWQPNLHRACHDNFSTMGRAINELKARGYQRIGLAMDAVDDERVNHLWLARYLTYQAAQPSRRRLPPLAGGPLNEHSLLPWIARAKPDAILTTRGSEVVRWLRKAGISVPGEIGVLNVYWRQDHPDCSGFYQDYETLGATAVDMVVAQLHRNERGLPKVPKVMLLPGEWREGATLRRTGEP